MNTVRRRTRSGQTAVSVPVFLLTILFLFWALDTGAAAQEAPVTASESCIVAESDSGRVLYEKNADSRMLVASTTKILTALVVLDRCDSREQVLIGDDFPAVEGSSMYLKPGEKLTVSDLLYGLMLASGNDAAVALAIYTAGGIDAFSALMNARAEELGCTDSHFVNPHGLDADGHYSTARDLWLIARAAMEDETFRTVVSTKYTTAGGRSLKNHNKLLWSCPGVIGIKTGYTESAGRSLVSCAEREGMRLICVTLSDPDDWRDHSDLYDWAYGHYQLVKIGEDDPDIQSLPVISGVKDEAAVRAGERFAAVFPKSDEITVAREAPDFVYAPVENGQTAGSITIRQNGKTIKTIPLVFNETVRLDERIPLSTLERIKRFLIRDTIRLR